MMSLVFKKIVSMSSHGCGDRMVGNHSVESKRKLLCNGMEEGSISTLYKERVFTLSQDVKSILSQMIFQIDDVLNSVELKTRNPESLRARVLYYKCNITLLNNAEEDLFDIKDILKSIFEFEYSSIKSGMYRNLDSLNNYRSNLSNASNNDTIPLINVFPLTSSRYSGFVKFDMKPNNTKFLEQKKSWNRLIQELDSNRNGLDKIMGNLPQNKIMNSHQTMLLYSIAEVFNQKPLEGVANFFQLEDLFQDVIPKGLDIESMEESLIDKIIIDSIENKKSTKKNNSEDFTEIRKKLRSKNLKSLEEKIYGMSRGEQDNEETIVDTMSRAEQPNDESSTKVKKKKQKKKKAIKKNPKKTSKKATLERSYYHELDQRESPLDPVDDNIEAEAPNMLSVEKVQVEPNKVKLISSDDETSVVDNLVCNAAPSERGVSVLDESDTRASQASEARVFESVESHMHAQTEAEKLIEKLRGVLTDLEGCTFKNDTSLFSWFKRKGFNQVSTKGGSHQKFKWNQKWPVTIVVPHGGKKDSVSKLLKGTTKIAIDNLIETIQKIDKFQNK